MIGNGNGYKISHPKLDCTYNVVLTREQYHQLVNELSELGDGKRIDSMSDLSTSIQFDDLVEIIRERY